MPNAPWMTFGPPVEAKSGWKQNLVAGGVVLFAAAIVLTYARRPGDFMGYVAAGKAILANKDIYRDTPPGVNNWPPFFSLLCVPLAPLDGLSPYVARVV